MTDQHTAAGDAGLPPLPPAYLQINPAPYAAAVAAPTLMIAAYTAEQMREYALAALAHPPASIPSGVKDALDIQFRLRTARRFAELQGEMVLSEQQCARHMDIDLVSWRKLVACFSAGTSFIEHDYPDALPTEDSESVLRAAMKEQP